jgi:hypothetical protein
VQRKLLNVSKNKSKTYDAQMSQIEQEEIDYDMQGAKIFAMLINHKEVQHHGLNWPISKIHT